MFSYQAVQLQDGRQGPRCEDCDARLESEGVMDVDMDMDGAGEGSLFACCSCGRNVCGTCAVEGMERHCLQCATRGY